MEGGRQQGKKAAFREYLDLVSTLQVAGIEKKKEVTLETTCGRSSYILVIPLWVAVGTGTAITNQGRSEHFFLKAHFC